MKEVEAADMGRSAGKVELQDNDLAAIHRACESLHSYSNRGGGVRPSMHVDGGEDSEFYDGDYGKFVGTAPQEFLCCCKADCGGPVAIWAVSAV